MAAAKYTIQTFLGQVIRNSDKKVIAPCASEEDPDFLKYLAWINAGNEPDVDDSEPAGGN